MNFAMSQEHPLFITKSANTEIGRWYAVYPHNTDCKKYSRRAFVGKNSVETNSSTNYSNQMKRDYICINTFIDETGRPVRYRNIKPNENNKYKKKDAIIIDCAIYSLAIKNAYAKFVAQHHRKKSEKRAAFTLALLNRDIDIYFAMSIARQYLP